MLTPEQKVYLLERLSDRVSIVMFDAGLPEKTARTTARLEGLGILKEWGFKDYEAVRILSDLRGEI